MSAGNLMLISFLTTIVFAAIGARIMGAASWKGAILGLAFTIGIAAAGSFTTNLLLALATGIIAIGVLMNPMGLNTKQATNAGLGCLIGYFVPALVLA